jgi:hypothetical protein
MVGGGGGRGVGVGAIGVRSRGMSAPIIPCAPWRESSVSRIGAVENKMGFERPRGVSGSNSCGEGDRDRGSEN